MQEGIILFLVGNTQYTASTARVTCICTSSVGVKNVREASQKFGIFCIRQVGLSRLAFVTLFKIIFKTCFKSFIVNLDTLSFRVKIGRSNLIVTNATLIHRFMDIEDFKEENIFNCERKQFNNLSDQFVFPCTKLKFIF